MAAIVTNKFRLSNAEDFHASFATDKYYLFIGKSVPWTDDTSPPTPYDTFDDENEVYRDMIAAKNVSAADVSFVVPRRNWTTGTIYDQYHHDIRVGNTSTSGATSLWDATFYVMNSNYDVYICISNANGAASTAEPTGTSTYISSTADSYKWKYLYTLTTSDVSKFLSLDFMPVLENSTVATAAVVGGIEHINITTAGSGYTNGTYTSQVIHGDGISGLATVVVAGGVISSVTATTAGSGYTFGSIVLTALEDSGVTTVDAVLDIVVSPSYGHGANNKKELGAFYVMMNALLSGADGSGDFIVSQDFRQVGVVKAPLSSGSAATATTLSALKKLTSTGHATNFVVDELITGGTSGALGKVVDFNSTTGVIKYIQQNVSGQGLATDGDIDAFVNAETVTGSTSTATGTSSAVTAAEIDLYSGDILYIENRLPIPRTTDQQENIKLIVEF